MCGLMEVYTVGEVYGPMGLCKSFTVDRLPLVISEKTPKIRLHFPVSNSQQRSRAIAIEIEE